MTNPQKIVLVVYFLLLAGCCFYVPWVATIEGIQNAPVGYSWIWAQPLTPAVPALRVIAVTIMAVTALSGAAFVLAGLRLPTTGLPYSRSV